MKRIVYFALGAAVLLVAGLAWYFFREPAPRLVGVNFAVSDFDQPSYEVGSVTTFVKDFTAPFDGWGERYGNEAYRDLLEEINASGEPRTIVTEVWYPAGETEGYPRATYGDFVEGDERLIRSLLGFLSESMTSDEIESVIAGLRGLERQSYIGAPAAAGRFPLVIFVHGLSGKRIDWNDAAERLAGRGYVVAAMTMPSDGTLPPVFNDPNSLYAASNGDDALSRAYEIMEADVKVFPKFLEFLYGMQVEGLSPATFPDLGGTTAPSGGADRMTEMMARLFQQRVDDVARVIQELRILASDAEECERLFALENLGGKPCGLLAGRIDFDSIGMSGHSLGSITTQVALRQLPELTAGLGLNNGIPERWEPQAHGIAPQHTRTNIDKPMFFLHGTEDAFVYFVFQLLFGDWYENSGGDRRQIFPSADEFAPRTPDNSQPVVFAAYNRAVGPKVVVSVLDGNHDGIDSPSLSRFLMERGVQRPMVARRLPDHEGLLGGFPGARFRLLEEATDTEGRSFRMPTFIANYYLSAWFDWHLRSDASALQRLLNPPFADRVVVQHSDLDQ